MSWLVGLALFIRFTQILPCCVSPPAELALRTHSCDRGFATACPRYQDCAPR